jgi:hypothetical protein
MSEHDFNRTAIPNRQRLPARALGGRFVLAGVVERLFGRLPCRRMPEPPKRSFSTEFAAQTFFLLQLTPQKPQNKKSRPLAKLCTFLRRMFAPVNEIKFYKSYI